MTNSFITRRAADLINNGGVIAYPTETVYGLGCHPDDVDSIARILELKQRPVRAGLIVIGDCLDRLEPWIDPTRAERGRLEQSTARPTTWIVTAANPASPWLTGGRARIAVRITDHPVAARLCAIAAAPLVSTSANRRGHRPAQTALQARHWFGREIDLVVPGVSGPAGQPSAVIDAASGEVLRA